MNITTFVEYAIQHGEALEIGNYKQANKLHKKLSKIYEALKKQERTNEIKQILDNPDESVRLWAATFLLKNDSESAIKVLKALTNSKKIFGLSASTTLDMWNKGLLKL